MLPDDLDPDTAAAVHGRLVVYGTEPNVAETMTTVLRAYLRATLEAAAATASLPRAPGREVVHDKVSVRELAEASDGTLTDHQVRHALEDGAFDSTAVRRRIMRDVLAKRELELLLPSAHGSSFRASQIEIVMLSALGEGWELTVGGGAYRPVYDDCDQRDVELLTPLIEDLAAVRGHGTAERALPPLVATDYVFGHNGDLRKLADGWCREYALPVGGEYVDVRLELPDPAVADVDQAWLTHVQAYVDWPAGGCLPEPLRVAKARNVIIEGEHLVPYWHGDAHCFALARPASADPDPANAAIVRCEELGRLLGSIAPQCRACDLRLDHFAYQRPQGWERMLVLLTLTQALTNGLL